MGVFKLAGMTVKSLFSKAPTRKYPYEKREPFERTRAGVMTTPRAASTAPSARRSAPPWLSR